MAKSYDYVSDEINQIFNEILSRTDLDRVVRFKLVCDNTLREMYKILKENDVHKFIAETDVVIIINEIVFENLDEEIKYLLIEEMITAISYDFEKDRLKIEDFDFKTFKGMLRKHGIDKIERMKDVCQLAIEQLFDKNSDGE